nr:hypothetical protein [Micromonospora sp. DSM 115978]
MAVAVWFVAPDRSPGASAGDDPTTAASGGSAVRTHPLNTVTTPVSGTAPASQPSSPPATAGSESAGSESAEPPVGQQSAAAAAVAPPATPTAAAPLTNVGQPGPAGPASDPHY